MDVDNIKWRLVKNQKSRLIFEILLHYKVNTGELRYLEFQGNGEKHFEFSEVRDSK